MRVLTPPDGKDVVQKLRRRIGDVYAVGLVLLVLAIALLMLVMGGALGQTIGAVLILLLLVIAFRAGSRAA